MGFLGVVQGAEVVGADDGVAFGVVDLVEEAFCWFLMRVLIISLS